MRFEVSIIKQEVVILPKADTKVWSTKHESEPITSTCGKMINMPNIKKSKRYMLGKFSTLCIYCTHF